MVTSFAIGQKDKKEYRIGFLMNKELAGNIKNLFNLNERVVGLIIKLNYKYFMKIIQVYAISAYDGVDVEAAVELYKIQ